MKKFVYVFLSVMMFYVIGSAEANPFDDTSISVTAAKSDVEETAVVATTESKTEKETNKEETQKEDKKEDKKTVEYTVQTGDYLYSIAKKYYGNGNMYPLIVEANKDKYPSLLTNPALIYTGWNLTLPDVTKEIPSTPSTVIANNTPSSSTPSTPSTTVTPANPAPATPSTPGSVTISADKVDMNVPKQCQFKSNVPGPGSACGPTSLSMILSYYGKGNTETLVTDLYNICGTKSPGGTDHEGLLRGAKQYGFANTYWKWGCTQAWCREQLTAGKPLLCHVRHHYVCLRGMDVNGNVIVNDPAREEVTRTMSWSEFVAWWQESGLGCSAMVVQ